MLRNNQAFDAILDALGNATRRDMLRSLTDAPMSVAELAARFPVSRPAISRHLAQLEQAGLVTHREAGNRNIYAIEPAGFARTAAWLNSFWNEAEARLRLVAENLAPEQDDA